MGGHFFGQEGTKQFARQEPPYEDQRWTLQYGACLHQSCIPSSSSKSVLGVLDSKSRVESHERTYCPSVLAFGQVLPPALRLTLLPVLPNENGGHDCMAYGNGTLRLFLPREEAVRTKYYPGPRIVAMSVSLQSRFSVRLISLMSLQGGVAQSD